MAGDEIKHKNSFLMSLNGQIQSAFFPFFDDVYCKYSFVCGPDWLIISGVEEGISQISKKGRDEDQLFVWNLPLNIVFKSTNPFGWPQLVISAYGSDAFDNEVVRGYGVCHAPIAPGRYEKEIQFYYSEIHVVAHWEATRVYRPKDSHTRRCERSGKGEVSGVGEGGVRRDSERLAASGVQIRLKANWRPCLIEAGGRAEEFGEAAHPIRFQSEAELFRKLRKRSSNSG